MNNKKGKRISIIVVLAAVALIAFLIINAIEIGVGISEKKNQRDDLIEANTAQDELNSELINKLDDENASRIFEDIAREEYDYIYPGERVYADSAN